MCLVAALVLSNTREVPEPMPLTIVAVTIDVGGDSSPSAFVIDTEGLHAPRLPIGAPFDVAGLRVVGVAVTGDDVWCRITIGADVGPVERGSDGGTALCVREAVSP